MRLLDHGDLQRWFESYFRVDARLQKIEWASMFRFHSRIAAKFRVGNSFLIGDAAHIHNPAGGQGLNLGIGDAVNIAWKLAQVVNNESPAWLLETYESERRPVARTVLKRTDLGFKLETGNNAVAVWMRTHVATRIVGVVSRLAPVRRMFFHLFSQLWVNYRGSRAVSAAHSGKSGPRPGDRAPYAPIAKTGEGASSVLDLGHGSGYHILLFDNREQSSASSDVAELAARLVGRYAAPVATYVIPPSETAAYRAYRVDGARAVLIRPDGHIAAIADAGDQDAIQRLHSHLDDVLVRARTSSVSSDAA
jgi:hypothetical protein